MFKPCWNVLIPLLTVLTLPAESITSLAFPALEVQSTRSETLKRNSRVHAQPSTIKIQPIRNFKAHNLPGESLIQIHYSPNGKYMVTGASDGLAKLWTQTGALVREFKGTPQALLFNARFSHDGQMIITAGYDGIARIWSVAGPKLNELKGHRSAVADAIFGRYSQQVITSSDDGDTKLWTLAGEQTATVTRSGVTRNLAVSPDGQIIAATQDLGVITLLNPSGKAIASIQTGQGRLNDVAFSADGKSLVTAGFDGTARVWTTTGQPLLTLKVLPKGWVTGADFSPDGRLIVTVSDDGALRLWNSSGQLLDLFRPNQGRLSNVSFHPEGQQLAVTAYDGTAWLLRLTK